MDAERELLKGTTPTLVLAVLRDGPLHGYGIAREIERRSEQALKCREGTLYPALLKLAWLQSMRALDLADLALVGTDAGVVRVEP